MMRQYTRLLTVIFGGSVLAPFVTYAASLFMVQFQKDPSGHWMKFAASELIQWQFLGILVLVFVATAVVWRLLRRFEPEMEAIARGQAEFVASTAPEYLGA